MKIYVIRESDVSPDALRSSWNPDRIVLARQPGRTNLNDQERDEGWLGTTGEVDRYALGTIDTDAPNWEQALAELVGPDYRVDTQALAEWVAGDEDEAVDIVTPVSVVTTEAATRDEEDYEEYWPTPREGWAFIATYGPEGDQVEGITAGDVWPYIETTACEWAGAVLDAAGIPCEVETHQTYDTTTSGIDWAYVAVREEDRARAIAAIQAAAAALSEE